MIIVIYAIQFFTWWHLTALIYGGCYDVYLLAKQWIHLLSSINTNLVFLEVHFLQELPTFTFDL